MIVGGDILLLLIGWFLLVSPQRSTAQSIARSVRRREAQIVEARKPVVQPKAATAADAARDPDRRTSTSCRRRCR